MSENYQLNFALAVVMKRGWCAGWAIHNPGYHSSFWWLGLQYGVASRGRVAQIELVLIL